MKRLFPNNLSIILSLWASYAIYVQFFAKYVSETKISLIDIYALPLTGSLMVFFSLIIIAITLEYSRKYIPKLIQELTYSYLLLARKVLRFSKSILQSVRLYSNKITNRLKTMLWGYKGKEYAEIEEQKSKKVKDELIKDNKKRPQNGNH